MKDSRQELSLMLNNVLHEIYDIICIKSNELITSEVVSAYLFKYIPQYFYENNIPLHALVITPMNNGYQITINQTFTKHWMLNSSNCNSISVA